MSEQCKFLKAVVLDWAGTTIDFGSRAPTMVFQKVFAEKGVPITSAQAREPMGMAKREHIAAVAAMPAVATAWKDAFGSECNEADIDEMYARFLPMQKSILHDHSELIPGAAEAVAACREMGLKIGSSTGYTHELMEIVTAAAEKQGYKPDLFLCAEDAPRGRPAPYLIFEAAKRLDVFPLWHVVKVDDTTVGVEAGRNAGCWSVGISRSGNLVGLSQAELASRSAEEQQQLCAAADQKLRNAGAHDVIESVAELPSILKDIDERLSRGERPSG